MKKFVFALEIMSLALLFPVYLVVELNHPTTGAKNTVYDQKIGPGKKGVTGYVRISLPGQTKIITGVK